MIDEPGSFSGQRQLAEARTAGPEPSRRISLAILNSDTATVLIAPCAEDHGVVRGERLELVRRRGEGKAGDRRDPVGDALGKAERRVEPGADGGAALGELHQHRQRLLDARDAVLDLRGVAGELLAEGERRRILRMGAADLDDLRPGLRLVVEGVAELLQRRDERGGRSPRPRRCASPSDSMSFDDWLMLTWSLGWTGFFEPSSPPSISIARLAITSLAFMLDCVPEPVCQTTSGKWSSSLPSITSCAARDDRARRPAGRAGRGPCSLRPAARLMMPSARTIGIGMPCPPIRKFSSERSRLRAPIAVGGDFDRAEGIGLHPGCTASRRGARSLPCRGHRLVINQRRAALSRRVRSFQAARRRSRSPITSSGRRRG